LIIFSFNDNVYFEFFSIGFMMFVDENQMMGGQQRNPQPRPGPNY